MKLRERLSAVSSLESVELISRQDAATDTPLIDPLRPVDSIGGVFRVLRYFDCEAVALKWLFCEPSGHSNFLVVR